MWKPLPSLAVSAECWIKAGGAHHSVLSYDVTAEMMKDWAEMMGIEFLHIGENTTVEDFEKEIFWNDIAYKVNDIIKGEPLGSPFCVLLFTYHNRRK